MVMPPRSCSSGMQSIRRELQRRRPKPLAPTKSTATKKSAPPPPSRAQIQADPSSVAAKCPPGPAGTHAPRPSRPRPHAPPRPSPTIISASTPPPPPCSAPSSIASASPSTFRADDGNLRPGTEVGVRTRTTTLKTGKVLVLWLRAMVVSSSHGGYEVVYDGNWPPGDPYGTFQVPRRHVRKIEPSSSRTSQPPSGAPGNSSASDITAAMAAMQKKEMRPPPRPTTAGKSLRLIRRSLLPEMEGKTRVALPGY